MTEPAAQATTSADDLAREFMGFRPRLLGIAYRMLGSAWDAEDVVAEAMVRWLHVDRPQVREPLAYLTTVVTRLALDQLRSARAQRESYVGPWLPEPMATEPSPLGPLDTVERRETVSLATLRMMEALTPAERAVLVLHEAFDLPHAEIAEILDITVEGSRQHLRRARARVSGTGKRFRPTAEAHDVLLGRFMAALEHGELDALEDVLAADVVHYSDGGGKVRAARHPIVGRDRVVNFYRGLRRRLPVTGVRRIEVNGQPAAWFRFGRQEVVLGLVVRDGRIHELMNVLSPDKLRYLHDQLDDLP
ncbi:MAG: RNA polymerase sigma factor SigJ [Acidimicrobiales bacterium]